MTTNDPQHDNETTPGGTQEDGDVSYMDTSEAGMVLGFQARTVRAMCAKGEIPSFLVGGEYRISRKEFRTWLATRRVTKPGETATPA